MLKFYTSHCFKCKMLSSLMDSKKIEYKEIDDENVYLPIADNSGILSMPFAELNGKIINTKELQEWVTNN